MIGKSDPNVDNAPGCGLGAYAIVLVSMGALSLVVMVGSTLSLLTANPTGPSELVPGAQVAVWRLQPMRDAGLLQLVEIPLAWHDESFTMNGTTACGLTKERLIRVAEGEGTAIPYTGFEAMQAEVTSYGGVVAKIRGEGAEISCTFGPSEGGDRFITQLEKESGLTAEIVKPAG